jgi:hypothetical protein
MHNANHSHELSQILCEVHAWELIHLPEFNSSSGKIIFMGLLHAFCTEGASAVKKTPMKTFYHNDLACDRTMRGKLKELHQLGLIQYHRNDSDLRCKHAYPSAKLIDKLNRYTQHVNAIIGQYFFLIEQPCATHQLAIESSPNPLSVNARPHKGERLIAQAA